MLSNMISMPKRIPRDFLLFLIAVSFAGFSQSMVDTTFNNFLKDVFSITDWQRAFLEFPREIPGLLVAFIGAAFFFISNRRLAVLANFLCGLGIFLIGLFSFKYSVMLMWLFIYSLGVHIFLPLNSSIGMELAREGRTGKRLGELSGMANAAAIIGSFIVFMGFRYLHFNFTIIFIISAAGYMAATSLMFLMKKDKAVSLKEKIRFRKKYGLFYWLNILYGTRKQLFLTFAPWVLVQIFSKKIEYVAMIFTIGGIVGILFKPLLGRAIDKFGERTILMAEAAVLIFVCIGYGFSRNIFSESIALIIASTCYIIDQLLMAVGMARATYLKKIAVKAEEIAPTLSIGVSIDHVFSISIALLGGLVWKFFGYQYVFLMGGIIAAVNLFSASRIRIKAQAAEGLISGTT